MISFSKFRMLLFALLLGLTSIPAISHAQAQNIVTGLNAGKNLTLSAKSQVPTAEPVTIKKTSVPYKEAYDSLCFHLPFEEYFASGLFETNQWLVDDNWRIAGSSGNAAPSAEFFHSPEILNYSQSLTSFYIIGPEIIDGKIMLEFDLKHITTNATETEFLAVEVLRDSSWVKVAEYTNAESFDWLNKSIAITSLVNNNIFHIRFRAYGANSTNIEHWLIDNIHIYKECSPPTDLYVDINPQNYNELLLHWEAPIENQEWLAWDDGINHDAIGLNDGGTFSAASRFTAQQLEDYTGRLLTRIKFFPTETDGVFTLKVWRVSDSMELILSQALFSYTPGMWNEVELDSPVLILPGQELWFGYTITHGFYTYVAGIDDGPAISGFGDMISMDGVNWESMSTAYGVNNNWNLEAGIDNVYINNNITTGAAIGNNSQLKKLKSAQNIPASGRGLISYNVYRNGILDGNTTSTFYIDPLPFFSPSICYNVTAVYEDCESSFSEEAWYYPITNVDKTMPTGNRIYPNPSNDYINIELSENINRMVVYNSMGQVAFEQSLSNERNIKLDVSSYISSTYLIRFIGNSGESFTKKVIVNY